MRVLHPLNTIPVGVALGSNEGDRLQNLQAARQRIMDLPTICREPAALSAPVYETEPVDCVPGTRAFLNTVVEVTCREPFSPTDFLAELRGIESALGRPTRYPRHAPRTVDLDILYAGSLRADRPELTLPHPRLGQRRFVLAPLAAIRPDFVVPGQRRPVAELLRALPPQPAVTLHAPHW